MQNFNAQAQGQPTIQRDSYLFIECTKELVSESVPLYSTDIHKYKIDPDDVRDLGIGAIVASKVQMLVLDNCRIDNVYVGSLL